MQTIREPSRPPAKKGVLSDFAFLFVHCARRPLVLFSCDLARRDRAEALKTLAAPGKTAASASDQRCPPTSNCKALTRENGNRE